MSDLAPNQVMCVMDVMGLTPYIEAKTPRHLPVNYMLEAVLVLVGNADSPDAVYMQEHLVHEYLDDVMDGYDYEEAMARKVTEVEWFNWLELIKGEVAQCAVELAKTLYPAMKPILQTCDKTYPNGCTLAVYQLATDGLYVDLTPAPLALPLSIAG